MLGVMTILNYPKQDPTPPQNWTDVKNCTADGSACVQIASILGAAPANMSEDCLFINVYSPEVSYCTVTVSKSGDLESTGSHHTHNAGLIVKSPETGRRSENVRR